MKLKVKICGITNLKDAIKAAELGADYLGFIFSASPRQVSIRDCKVILAGLEQKGLLQNLKTVAVCVNETKVQMESIVRECGIDFIQLHGNEKPDFANGLAFSWYRVFRIKDENDILNLSVDSWNCQRILVDALVAGVYGGTGNRISPKIALMAGDMIRKSGKEFFLAGGLNTDNIKEAVLSIKPDGIDISSGVETRPGKKSFSKLEKLFRVIGEISC
jgi:phosphoribosylanthranilate isomerase